jgi:hypothetical protein
MRASYKTTTAAVLSLTLVLGACVGEAPDGSGSGTDVLDVADYPPDYEPGPDADRAEVITLTFAAYAAVALIATIAAAQVYYSSSGELAQIIGDAMDRAAFEHEIRREERDEAAYLNRTINRGFYRNNSYGSYWLRTSDLLSTLNNIENATISTALAFGEGTRRYLRSVRTIAMKARNRTEYRDGGCVKAKVRSLEAPYTWHEAAARYYSPEDVIAAASYASLKAMGKCAKLDADVMESFYALFPDTELPSFSLDSMIEYGWKSFSFLYTYRQKCSFPPALAVSKDPAGCQ